MKARYIRRRLSVVAIAMLLHTAMASVAQDSQTRPKMVLPASRLLRIEADSARGFNFPYFLFMPAGMPLHDTLFLLVEPNNTGFPNDTLAVHERAARHAAGTSSVGNAVANTLRIPLLAPIFPRPMSDSLTYTHALDRDAILITHGQLKRLDRQLLAMVDHARLQLRVDTFRVELREKILLTGFSASGTFVNRMTVIHPDRVAAIACGGINAMPILPLATLRGTPLNYPLGLHDFRERFGEAPNLDKYRQIPQFLYMGERDENDAVLYEDAYSQDERRLIFSLIGRKMLPDRWATCAAAYHLSSVTARFNVYLGIGHGTDNRINGEVAQFFQRAANLPVSK